MAVLTASDDGLLELVHAALRTHQPELSRAEVEALAGEMPGEEFAKLVDAFLPSQEAPAGQQPEPSAA